MLNEHFVQSEVEYLRQQRLAAAAEYRRARTAARVRTLRDRFAAVVGHLTPARTQQQPQLPQHQPRHARHAQPERTAARAA